ncbi:MAG TPA: alpha/beta hydrolase [Thermoanaerobaculia bacterium]|nr:alpha/beta hydrolase [Thermoanaerobaculia bacterium]
MPEPFHLTAAGHRLEAVWHGPPPDAAPTIVMLHEGLGCVAAWRDGPARLARETGLGVLVYSRWGYGKSDPVEPPRPLRYMHDEALDSLPEVLAAAGVGDAILLGHSDGASIALIYAGSPLSKLPGAPRIRGLVLLAPHVFCEDLSVEAIARAREAYLQGDLRDRLAKHHGENVEGAFWGWNRAWLDPGFRDWNLEEFLPGIEIPVLVIQSESDPYGTLAQVDAIERGVRGPFSRLILSECGHAPQKDRPEETTAAVVDFVRRVVG